MHEFGKILRMHGNCRAQWSRTCRTKPRGEIVQSCRPTSAEERHPARRSREVSVILSYRNDGNILSIVILLVCSSFPPRFPLDAVFTYGCKFHEAPWTIARTTLALLLRILAVEHDLVTRGNVKFIGQSPNLESVFQGRSPVY